MAFTSRHPQDSNAQQLLCACVGLHAFMFSLAERVEHLLIASESSDVARLPLAFRRLCDGMHLHKSAACCFSRGASSLSMRQKHAESL